jgi:LmbE family N-acetylglucosaminyl deacetylase
MRFASALVIFAHPDDAEFMCGGTVAAWAKEGTEVHYCVVTDGSAGSNEPGVTREQMVPVREREQRAAAEILGVAGVHFLGFVDGELEVTRETRAAVTRVVRRVRPEVIVAPDPSRLWSGNGYINHWDHKQAGTLALCAVMPDAPSRPQFSELLDEGLEPFEVPNLWLAAEDPDTYVDIGKTLELKLEALRAHESQGTDDAEDWVRQRARELGEQGGMEYAEAFRAFDFTEDR